MLSAPLTRLALMAAKEFLKVHHGVYRITDPSGRSYVGSSAGRGGLYYRLRTHLTDLKGSKHHSMKLQHAWKLHPVAFIFEILESYPLGSQPIEFVRRQEQVWIDKLEAFTLGYNCQPKAQITDYVQKPMTPEHKERIRQALIAHYRKPGSREATAEATRDQWTDLERKNRPGANSGRVFSAEVRDKMRQAKLGKKQSPEHIASRTAITPERQEKKSRAATLAWANPEIRERTRQARWGKT